MNKTLSTACALFALAMAGSAFADGSVKATLESPVSGKTKLIAAHAVWNCEGVTCTAALAPDDANDAFACKDLARQVGRIASYQQFKALDEKGLAKCNTAAATKTIGTASR
jgi:hypothetical protein